MADFMETEALESEDEDQGSGDDMSAARKKKRAHDKRVNRK